MSRTYIVAIGTALVVSLATGAGWSQVGFKATPLMQTTTGEVGVELNICETLMEAS